MFTTRITMSRRAQVAPHRRADPVAVHSPGVPEASLDDLPPRPPAETQARELRTAIAARLRRGESLDCVEHELIAPSRLSEQQKSALRLYGWVLHQRPHHEAGNPPSRSRWEELGIALHPRRHLAALIRRRP